MKEQKPQTLPLDIRKQQIGGIYLTSAEFSTEGLPIPSVGTTTWLVPKYYHPPAHTDITLGSNCMWPSGLTQRSRNQGFFVSQDSIQLEVNVEQTWFQIPEPLLTGYMHGLGIVTCTFWPSVCSTSTSLTCRVYIIHSPPSKITELANQHYLLPFLVFRLKIKKIKKSGRLVNNPCYRR